MSRLLAWVLLQGVLWLLLALTSWSWQSQVLVQIVLVQALLIGYRFGERCWHLGLSLAVAAAGTWALPPALYLGIFLLLWFIFGRVDRDRVPFYLSSRHSVDILAPQLPAGARFVDLGCATAGLLIALAQRRPDVHFAGVEQSWFWSSVARWRCRRLDNCRIERGDLWHHSLSEVDLAYAFLSPAPMAALWRKACAEMPPGARLISNTFTVPNQTCSARWPLPGGRLQTALYVYQIPPMPPESVAPSSAMEPVVAGHWGTDATAHRSAQAVATCSAS